MNCNMRKIAVVSFLVALGQCLSGLAFAQQPDSLAVAPEASVSIEQCYELARANYPLLKKYELIDKSEQLNLKMAAHAYIPQISIDGKATYQNEALEFPFEIPPVIGTIPDFSKDQYQIALEVTQIVWDGGLTASKRKSARAEAQSSREEFEVDMYALRSRINNLFFGILLIQEQMALNDIMVAQLEDNAARVEKCMASGVASSSDRDMIEVEIISANQKKVQMETMLKAYTGMLSLMIGKNVNAASLVRPVMPGNDPYQAITELSLSPVMRPELRLMDARIHEIEVQESMLYTHVMPRIGLFVRGMYGRPGLNMMSNDFALNAIGGITLSWNFGALYNLRSGKNLLRTNKRQLEVMKETFVFNNNLQSLNQSAESEKFVRLIEDDDRIIGLRTRIRESVENAMENGARNASDLIQEISREQAARQQKAVHEIELLKSVYELKDLRNQ